MRIEQVIKLATDAANGKDNFKKGAVGSNGYGFVFKDKSHPKEPYIIYGSHKFCGAGAYRDQLKNIKKKLKNYDKSNFFSDLLRYDHKLDLLFAGSLKTLVPTLQFGPHVELLFDVWMLVMTPEGQLFPATFYWGQSGLSIGAWSEFGAKFYRISEDKRDPMEDFPELKEFSPFDFIDDATGRFLDALEFALKKVPVSDFWGIYTYDLGNNYMGVKKGKPFIEYLKHVERYPEAEKKLKPLLGKILKDKNGDLFSIKRLTTLGLYALQFEVNKWDKFFGNARDVLEAYEEFMGIHKPHHYYM